MPIMIRQDCPCCKLSLHHCERCWNKYHNGIKHKDYEPPEYFGQPFFPEEITKKVNEDLRKMAIELGKEFKEIEPKIKPNRNRKYDGDYGH